MSLCVYDRVLHVASYYPPAHVRRSQAVISSHRSLIGVKFEKTNVDQQRVTCSFITMNTHASVYSDSHVNRPAAPNTH